MRAIARARLIRKLLLQDARHYFGELESVAESLREMAEYRRSGTPFNDAQMAFINDAVRESVSGVCGGPRTYAGWYTRLLISQDPDAMDPVISDVHTDPGPQTPSVLHVGTGLPRLMVVTTDSCEGPRAYAGLAFAYHEVVSPGLHRLTDPEWAPKAKSAADVPWMREILP